ncbi:hypothetical protein J8F10_13625 [Gemmata sp. G18]|uniref:DUF3168 domain-containing protein n=1 Tax=Gemmata palustris TaxID=2822762 RepID=A0ABS5BRN0_9BACT|nr:hypothetical protein [Gemmata palustris]MBP3956325.1 hypothetical protein [Gemmata palustris]
MPGPPSNLDTILDAVVTAVRELNFKLTGPGSVPVVKRKLPKREEAVDPSEQVTVSGAAELDSVTPIAFGDVFRVRYRVEVTLVTSNKNDQVKNLPEYLAFRQQVRQLFRKPPLVGAAAVVDLDVVGGEFLDRGMISQGYDYQQVVIRVTTIEP